MGASQALHQRPASSGHVWMYDLQEERRVVRNGNGERWGTFSGEKEFRGMMNNNPWPGSIIEAHEGKRSQPWRCHRPRPGWEPPRGGQLLWRDTHTDKRCYRSRKHTLVVWGHTAQFGICLLLLYAAILNTGTVSWNVRARELACFSKWQTWVCSIPDSQARSREIRNALCLEEGLGICFQSSFWWRVRCVGMFRNNDIPE